MGIRTRAVLVSEGLLMAGNESLTTRANIWLDDWLRNVYRSWPWPFLNRRASGIALAAGTTALTIGGGSGGITLDIQRLIDPLYVYNSTKTAKQRARIVALNAGPIDQDESVLDSTLGRSIPIQFKARANSALWGKWDLIPYPVPDVAYLLAFDYLEQPANLASDSTIPLYPNDRTMMWAVMAAALVYTEGVESPPAQAALSAVDGMVVQDRMKYGEVPGINDVWGLDPNVFR
jgi:hypothetical protein